MHSIISAFLIQGLNDEFFLFVVCMHCSLSSTLSVHKVITQLFIAKEVSMVLVWVEP